MECCLFIYLNVSNVYVILCRSVDAFKSYSKIYCCEILNALRNVWIVIFGIIVCKKDNENEHNFFQTCTWELKSKDRLIIQKCTMICGLFSVNSYFERNSEKNIYFFICFLISTIAVRAFQYFVHKDYSYINKEC